MDISQVMVRLRKAIEKAGSIRKFSIAAGVDPSTVCNTLRARQSISPKVLDALGIERRVTYHTIGKGK